jgi:ABC-type multidrug transport system ATPase subunit
VLLRHDVVREAVAVRRRIALAGQAGTVAEGLTGRENLLFLVRCPVCPAVARGHVPPG